MVLLLRERIQGRWFASCTVCPEPTVSPISALDRVPTAAQMEPCPAPKQPHPDVVTVDQEITRLRWESVDGSWAANL